MGLCQFVKSLLIIVHFFQKSLIQKFSKYSKLWFKNSVRKLCTKNWAHQCKIQFKLDSKKQANEVIFFQISYTCAYHPVTFNNNILAPCPHQKHLRFVFDSKLDFSIHIEQKIRNCSKIIGLIRRLSVCLSRKALLTFCKSFARPLLNCGVIFFDKPGNLNFECKIEKVQ